MRINYKLAKDILDLINSFDTILVFRHDSPDYDALGSQFGMVNFLKHNFKNKTILAPGFSNVILADGLYPDNDAISEEIYNSDFLAIVLDTSNSKRISDQNYIKAKKIIKIDHHPMGDEYGDINLVRENAAAACELIYDLLTSKAFKEAKLTLNDEAAKFLYSGLVGDTGRFQYNSTTKNTLKVAYKLSTYNFNMADDVYYPMYKKPIKDFAATQFVMNHYNISKNGVAYYTLFDKDLKELELDPDEGKAYLHLFNYYDEIKVWVCFVEDKRNNNFRASVRSRHVIINTVCGKFNGGGHAGASGARLDNYEHCLKLIDALDNEVIKSEK